MLELQSRISQAALTSRHKLSAIDGAQLAACSIKSFLASLNILRSVRQKDGSVVELFASCIIKEPFIKSGMKQFRGNMSKSPFYQEILWKYVSGGCS